MRKGITPIVGIVLALLIFLIGGALVGSAKDKIAGGAAIIRESFDDWDIGVCKKIEGSEVNDLVESIKRVYAACDADSNKCGESSCERMTLVLPDGVQCYKIDKDALVRYGLNDFINGAQTGVRCCVTSAIGMAGGAEEIDYYNPPKCTMQDVDTARCDKMFNRFFSISNGAKITVSATQSGLLNSAGTDIILKAKDATSIDYSSCTPPP